MVLAADGPDVALGDRHRTMTPHLLSTMRELHARVTDGLHVRLLWSEVDGCLAVSVEDLKHGGWFAVEVRDGDDPLRAFQHPFAYAAWRGVETSAVAA